MNKSDGIYDRMEEMSKVFANLSLEQKADILYEFSNRLKAEVEELLIYTEKEAKRAKELSYRVKKIFPELEVEVDANIPKEMSQGMYYSSTSTYSNK